MIFFYILYTLSCTIHPLNGPLSVTTQVRRYQKGKTNLDFTGARDSQWQWHQLGHMQVCTLLQTDNHASTPPLSFLQAGCPSCRPTNSVKAMKALHYNHCILYIATCKWPLALCCLINWLFFQAVDTDLEHALEERLVAARPCLVPQSFTAVARRQLRLTAVHVERGWVEEALAARAQVHVALQAETILRHLHHQPSTSNRTSLCSASYVHWQRGTARISSPLLQKSSDISCLPRTQNQTYSSGFAAVGLRWDRRTDGHSTIS